MTKLEKIILAAAGFLIFMGIVLGALGAHALKSVLSAESLESFKTGVFYQLTQSLALLVLVLVQKTFQLKLKPVFLLNLIGIILFSWSIFGLTLSKLLEITFLNSILGPITPIGGLLMIISWLIFIIKVLKSAKNP